MPNWCYGWVKVKGKPKDIENFCKHFLFSDDEDEDIKRKYFARSFMNESWDSFKKANLGKNKAEFGLDFAWSVTSCIIEGYPQDKENKGKCITLMDACKEHNVLVEIESEEGGCGFEEHIICNEKGELILNDCKDMPEHTCLNCGNKQMIRTNADLEDEECSECGECAFVDKLKQMCENKIKQGKKK